MMLKCQTTKWDVQNKKLEKEREKSLNSLLLCRFFFFFFVCFLFHCDLKYCYLSGLNALKRNRNLHVVSMSCDDGDQAVNGYLFRIREG